MKKVMLDTNAYTEFKLGNEKVRSILQYADIIGMNAIVLGECLAGFACGTKQAKNRKELDEFLSSSRVEIFNVTNTTASFYATVYATLKRKGKPIPTNDMWIAALTLEQGCWLCSYDKRFNEIDNLQVCTDLESLLP